MEGFGVLRACALAGVPGVELRAISNAVNEADRSRWRIDEALELLARRGPSCDRGAECVTCRRRCRLRSERSGS